MKNALQQLKIWKLGFAMVVSTIIVSLVFRLVPISKDYEFILITVIVLYLVPSMWIIYGLSKYGTSIKEWFKPIEGKKVEMIFAIIMVLALCSGLLLIVEIPIRFMGDITETTFETNIEGQTFFMILTSVIIAPVAEEIFFRGYVLNRLRIKNSTKKAIIITSVLFGIVHLLGGLHAAIAGICFAVLYIKYKNLLIAIIAHGLYNAMLVVKNWLLLNKGDWLLLYSREWVVPLLIFVVMMTVISCWWFGRFVKSNADSFKDMTINQFDT